MPAFSPEQWRVLSPYLDEVLDVPVEARGAWLESLRESNPTLATDLQALLKEHRELGGEQFLRTVPALPGTETPLIGQTVGGYTLESPLGQGGMGTVWLARRSDGRFEGRAAVKFLKVAFLGGAGEDRFKREGSVLARLAHANIAHLIDAGVSGAGQPYLILEYIEGKNVDGYCNEHALSIRARIHLFLEVLAAVAHAHANLIVHRDLKPSNVLVTADGKVKLLDFGIAKLLEDEAAATAATALTREGDRALTLAYASPEQVTGGAVTTATDVYALGVLLYLLLVGKHPAESALQSPADLMKAILDTQPPRPSDVLPATDNRRRVLRGDLDTIVAKALKKNPAERYPSVTALAEDLHRYLRDEPISARRDTLAYRAKKFVLRNWLPVTLAVVALLVTLSALVVAVMEARTARKEREFALQQLARAEAINDLNSFVLSDAPSGKAFTVNDLLGRAEELVGRQRGDDAGRAELLWSIGKQYAVQEEYAKANRLLDEAYTLARALPDRSTRARAACALAQSRARQGDLPNGERLFKEALAELPDDARFALDRAFCMQCGAEVAIRRGDASEGVARAQGAQLAVSQSPFRPPLFELDNLMTLASVHRYAGHVKEANAAFEQASARLTELGRADTQKAVKLFNNWGLALWIWGRPLDSERVLRRVISLSERSPAEPAAGPMVLLNYSRPLYELGKFKEAQEYAERAYARAKITNDQMITEQSLLMLSVIYRKQGDFERAEKSLSEVETTLRRNLPAGHAAFSSLAISRALIAQERGDMKTALDLANQAVATLESRAKEGREGVDYLKRFLPTRSEMQRKLGHYDEAERDARRALQMLLDATQPGTFSCTIGRVYLALGRALLAQGKGEEASAAFRSAVEHLQSTLGPDHAETLEARQLADADAAAR